MADVKPSGLPSDTSLDDNHYIIINDPAGPTTKRTTLATIKAWIQSIASLVTTAMIGDSQVTGSKLSTGAIFLGRATYTAGSMALSTSYADFLSLTVTVPAGGRAVRLVFIAPQQQGSGGNERIEARWLEGSTILQRWYSGLKNPGTNAHYETLVPAPSAGSHTYKFNAKLDIGTSGLFYSDNTGSTIEAEAYLV